MTWTLDGVNLGQTLEEAREWDGLELTVRVDASTVENTLRPLLQGAGKIQAIPFTTGDFEVVTRGGGVNEVTLTAESSRQDARPVDTWFVEGLEEEPIGKEAREYEVTIEALPEKNKAFDNEYGTLSSPYPDYVAEPKSWYMDFEAGDVVTPRVTTDASRQPETGLTLLELVVVATVEENRIIEESVSQLEATSITSVPDGQNIVVDESGDDRNTVFVRAPFQYAVDLSGGYMVADYTQLEPSPLFTVGTWVEVSSGSEGVLFAHRDGSSTSAGWEVSVSAGNLSYTDAEGASVSGSTTVDDGELHHIMLGYAGPSTGSGSGVYLYVDGELDNSGTAQTAESSTLGTQQLGEGTVGTQNWSSTAGEFVIGAYSDGSSSLNCTVYEATYHDTRLEDYQRMYTEDRVSEWDLKSGSGSTADDKTSNNLDGNLTGHTWQSVLESNPESTVPSGEYVVMNWESEWAFSDAYTVTLEAIQL